MGLGQGLRFRSSGFHYRDSDSGLKHKAERDWG